MAVAVADAAACARLGLRPWLRLRLGWRLGWRRGWRLGRLLGDVGAQTGRVFPKAPRKVQRMKANLSRRRLRVRRYDVWKAVDRRGALWALPLLFLLLIFAGGILNRIRGGMTGPLYGR